jgi:DNA-binding CsgD family transcriptional regulator
MRERDATADIYDAAVTPGGWPSLPGIFAKLLPCDSAVLTLNQLGRTVEGATHNLPADAMRSYAEHYHRVDPWFAAGRDRLPAFHASLSTDLVPERLFVQTEFYVDFARDLGTVQAVGGFVPIGPSAICSVALHRDRRARPFSGTGVNRLQRLLPHLQRALLLGRRIGERSAIGFAALDALAVGALACDAAGRVLFANAAAEAACAAGAGIVLGARAAGLGARHPSEARRLAGLIADAAAGGPGGGLVIRGDDEARLFVLVTPLPSAFSVEPGRALVTLRPENASPTLGQPLLEQLFGMTPAEAALALALMTGRALAEIAAERAVSQNTLRSQLAQVLRKTGTANQRELVRVLSLVPALRG